MKNINGRFSDFLNPVFRMSFGALAVFVLGAIGPPASAKLFHVTNVTELQDALREASGNRQNDIIFIDRGTYLLRSGLTHTVELGFRLVIAGLPWQKPLLVGSEFTGSILRIEEGIAGSGGDIELADVAFTGGRILGSSSATGIVKISGVNPNISVQNCAFFGNEVTTGALGGATVYLRSQKGSIIFRNNIVYDNVVDATRSSGGVKIVSASAQVINNTFIRNAGWVGGVWLQWADDRLSASRRSYVVNNIIYGNTGGRHGDALVDLGRVPVSKCPYIYIEHNNTTSADSSSLIFPRRLDSPLGPCFHPWSISDNIYSSPGVNLRADSRFAMTYALGRDSPVIDSGGDYPALWGRFAPVDYKGKARYVDGNNDGIKQVDIGAIEWSP